MHLGLKNGPLLPKGRIEMTRRRGRRRKQLLDDFFCRIGVRSDDDSTHSATVVRRALWRYIDSGDKSEFCAAGNFGAQFLIGAVSGVDCTVCVGLSYFPSVLRHRSMAQVVNATRTLSQSVWTLWWVKFPTNALLSSPIRVP